MIIVGIIIINTVHFLFSFFSALLYESSNVLSVTLR